MPLFASIERFFDRTASALMIVLGVAVATSVALIGV
jgi:hypothetical protein